MIYRRIFTLLFAILPLFMVAQTPKKVAVMETKKITDEVTQMQCQMVRGGLETAVAKASGYEGYDRTSFDDIMREQNFQRSGAVSDEQIRKLGEMAGVQYIIVSEASAEGADFYVLVKMLDVETGKFGAVYDKLCTTSATEINKACTELGAMLFGSGQYNVELQLPEGRYVGDILDEKPHGQGIMYYKSDDSRERVSYEGGWVNGNREGYGTIVWKDGRKYEGNWKDDKNDGYGTLYLDDGTKYVGNFKEGKLNGQVTIYYASGRKAYEGNFKDNEMDGYGTGYYEDGTKYVGNFKNSKCNGQGTHYYADGRKRYEGNWKDDKYDGYGTLYLDDGTKYVGNWKGGYANGQGTEYYADGRKRYEGNWNNNKYDGNGSYYDLDGIKYVGNWKNGKPSGLFTVYFPDGRKEIQTY